MPVGVPGARPYRHGSIGRWAGIGAGYHVGMHPAGRLYILGNTYRERNRYGRRKYQRLSDWLGKRAASRGVFKTYTLSQARRCGSEAILTYRPDSGVVGAIQTFHVKLATARGFMNSHLIDPSKFSAIDILMLFGVGKD
jgi:hypothetical protein